MSEQQLITAFDRVKIAFRKLKSHVYFDKTALPLRDKIVEFEARNNFYDELRNIADVYELFLLSESSPLMSEILSSINVLAFPKKMCSSKQDDNATISVGSPKEKPIVEEFQHFIDMDVRGHIIGILWIMAFGKRLEDSCFGNARGNRLRKSLIWNDDDETLDLPTLFEPYFAQYSLWRDKGLSFAEDLLAKGHDALIITLDLKRFYYRTGINELVFNEILKDEDDAKDKALHSAVFSMLKRYTEVLRERSIDKSGIVLPIGFLPSAILSNWCLSKFDKGILDFWNPIYYGRYVDDIIIVEKIEKKSEIYNRARKDELSKDYVIDYYLGTVRRTDALYFASKEKHDHVQRTAIVENAKLPTCGETNAEHTYRVNPKFCLTEESLYEFCGNKTRIYVLFADNNSTALINKFKKEIYENVSGFRLMPEVDGAFSKDDFSEFYRLENDATINKLRGIQKIQMDKYELSKFLGKYRVVSSLMDDRSMKQFTRFIGKMFNDSEIIENYILWERIFEIFITDRDYSGFSKFAKKVKTAIDSLRSEEGTTANELAKKSLQSHLKATFNRTLSLVWGEKANEIIKKVCDDSIKVSLRKEYLSKRMTNKTVTVIPITTLTCPSDSFNVNFTNFSEGFEYLRKNGMDTSIEEFLPFFHQAQDIAFEMLLKSILDNSDDKTPKTQENFYKEYIDKIDQKDSHRYFDAPIRLRHPEKASDPFLINVGTQNASKLKIAVANVNVNEVWNLKKALSHSEQNRKSSRYHDLARLMNIAIKEKADMLVLPENYVPIEWIPSMALKASHDDIAIITGVEHICVDKKVYNYTAVILPFKYYNRIPTAALFFQLKKHYSPAENQIIEGYGFKSMVGKTEKRPIYRWKDCYFPVYCCYELASIHDRAEFMSWADMVVAVECNRDTNYFSSIVESLTRDLHCYIVQVNTSEFGDSRISQPTKRENQNILTVKGGINQTVLIGEVDLQSLRKFQIMNYSLQKDGNFKPTPPGIEVSIIREKMGHKLD